MRIPDIRCFLPVALPIFMASLGGGVWAEERVAGKVEKRAVVVGVNAYERGRPLRGCVNDANSMMRLLVERFAFAPENIRLILDGEATRANIEAAINDMLVARSEPGDVAVFFFSGHGTQVPDDDGDEADGMDEVICPVDMSEDPRSWYRDDLLNYQMAKLRTDRVMVLIDTCHSGTITRSLASEEKYFDLGFRSLRAYREGPDAGFKDGRAPAAHIVLTASQASETALEDTPRRRGLFAGHVMDFLRNSSGDEVSLGELMDYVTPRVGAYVEEGRRIGRLPPHFRQTPSFEGERDVNLAALLGGEPYAGSPVSSGPSGVIPPEVLPSPGYSGGEIEVEVGTDRLQYQYGDFVQVRLRLSEPAFVRLYYQMADGKVILLFPNRFHPESRIPGDRVVVIPDDISGDFALRVKPPAGGEVLLAVASTVQFDDSDIREALLKGDFAEIDGDVRLHKLRARGLEVVGKPGGSYSSGGGGPAGGGAGLAGDSHRMGYGTAFLQILPGGDGG